LAVDLGSDDSLLMMSVILVRLCYFGGPLHLFARWSAQWWCLCWV